MLDAFAFFGADMYDSIKGPTSLTPIGSGNARPLTQLMEYNATSGELGENVNATVVDQLMDFVTGGAFAVLDATGVGNYARQISSAVVLFIGLITAPFSLGALIGANSIWFVGTLIQILYTFLIALALLAVWRGGSI